MSALARPEKGFVSSGAIGSAGELIVQAKLLVRGWTVGNVNSGGMMNAPAIDLLAMKGSKRIAIAVKTTGSGGAQWSVNDDWGEKGSLFKGATRPDFVVFVRFTPQISLDAHDIFIVPADVVDADVFAQHTHWHKYPKRDGSPRKLSRHTAISWQGKDTTGNIGRGFAQKWAQYKDAWVLLESDRGGHFTGSTVNMTPRRS